MCHYQPLNLISEEFQHYILTAELNTGRLLPIYKLKTDETEIKLIVHIQGIWGTESRIERRLANGLLRVMAKE